ncbi:MAG: hypothetical protein HOH82_25535 [Planctomycetaceae bacterium]|nr:hypothetical protein [Planctomycetaceae bacterium]
MSKTILMIHGRHFKPPKKSLEELWLDALRFGIERDSPSALPNFDAARKEFVYYGDISNKFLERATGEKWKDDTASRRTTLARLKKYKKSQFTKAQYGKLPGASGKKEALADVFAGFLSAVRLSDWAIKSVAPDMREYWNSDSQFGSDVRHTMMVPLKKAMDRNDDIMVISHSLGTMISYDTFWKFCRLGEYRPKYTDKKVHQWITLGSPLADETVKRHLKGANASGVRRYPSNIVKWANVAAEDDFISHDGVVSNDYKEMKERRLVRSITDKRIFNLGVRDGKSNPHTAMGYLVHPYVSRIVSRWV